MYIPNTAKIALKELGVQLKFARKRRQWTISSLALKMGVTAPTIMSLEKGQPTVSLGVFVSALWVLGLEDQLKNLFQFNDIEGIKLMNDRLPKKIRSNQRTLNNDF